VLGRAAGRAVRGGGGGDGGGVGGGGRRDGGEVDAELEELWACTQVTIRSIEQHWCSADTAGMAVGPGIDWSPAIGSGSAL
jgi:hypothetical protein